MAEVDREMLESARKFRNRYFGEVVIAYTLEEEVVRYMATFAQSQVAAAVEAEREACEHAALDQCEGINLWDQACTKVAAAIRARRKEPANE
jgi:hypothetical protein